jgi:hypothetical protein
MTKFWIKNNIILDVLANKKFFTLFKIKLFTILLYLDIKFFPCFGAVVGSGLSEIRDGKKSVYGIRIRSSQFSFELN